jgi:Zn ribbon nucleic-acid-binding protein
MEKCPRCNRILEIKKRWLEDERLEIEKSCRCGYYDVRYFKMLSDRWPFLIPVG